VGEKGFQSERSKKTTGGFLEGKEERGLAAQVRQIRRKKEEDSTTTNHERRK